MDVIKLPDQMAIKIFVRPKERRHTPLLRQLSEIDRNAIWESLPMLRLDECIDL